MLNRNTYKAVRDILRPLRDNGLFSEEEFKEVTGALYAATERDVAASQHRLITKEDACRMLADISRDTLDRIIKRGIIRCATITRNRCGVYLTDVEKVILDGINPDEVQHATA